MKFCSRSIKNSIAAANERLGQASGRISSMMELQELTGKQVWLVHQHSFSIREPATAALGYTTLRWVKSAAHDIIPWTVGPFLLVNTGGGEKIIKIKQELDENAPIWNVDVGSKQRFRVSSFNIPNSSLFTFYNNAIFRDEQSAILYGTWLMLSAETTQVNHYSYEYILKNNNHVDNMINRFLENINERDCIGGVCR